MSTWILTLEIAIIIGSGDATRQMDVRNWPKQDQWQLITELGKNVTNPSKTLPIHYNLHCLIDTCVKPTTVKETTSRPIVGTRIERDYLPSTRDMYETQCEPVTESSGDYRLKPSLKGSTAPRTRSFRYPIRGNTDMNYVTGHVTTVDNPRFVSLLEPGGKNGCSNGQRFDVVKTARTKRCLTALSAGFFDAFTGSCLGNNYSEGKLLTNSSIRNAHFGITTNNELFFGYLGLEDSEKLRFRELVNGVVWLVRDGKNYVNESYKKECMYTAREEEDAVNRFLQVSARAAIGHDSEGRLLLINVNGKTYQSGMTLYELADFLVFLGVENAVNMDGGGSVTLVLNGTVVNQPADIDQQVPFMKTRDVGTVLCVHAPYCVKAICSGKATYMVDEKCLCYEHT